MMWTKRKLIFAKKSSIQKNFVSGKNSLLVMWLSSGVETGEIFSEKTERMGVSNRRRRRIIFKANRRKKKKMKILQILLCADVKGFVSPPMNRRRMLWTFWLFFFRPKERLVVETLSMRLQFREHSFCFETKFKERETERESERIFASLRLLGSAFAWEALQNNTHTKWNMFQSREMSSTKSMKPSKIRQAYTLIHTQGRHTKAQHGMFFISFRNHYFIIQINSNELKGKLKRKMNEHNRNLRLALQLAASKHFSLFLVHFDSAVFFVWNVLARLACCPPAAGHGNAKLRRAKSHETHEKLQETTKSRTHRPSGGAAIGGASAADEILATIRLDFRLQFTHVHALTGLVEHTH